MLQEINASEQRGNNYSLMAYESLLDFNLPAKYSLTGRLAPHNLITDGFYDVGQVSYCVAFLLLCRQTRYICGLVDRLSATETIDWLHF